MMTRRSLFNSAIVLSMTSLFNSKKQNTFVELHRTFYYPSELTLEQISKQSQTYVDYKEVYFLDREFQIKGMLHGIKYSRTGAGQTTTIRSFSNKLVCEEWQNLYKRRCLIENGDPNKFHHRYEDVVV